MSWVPQVSEVSRKMFAAYSSLKRVRNFLPISTKITLAQSLLLPILDYADSFYLDLTVELLNKLELLQNVAIRFIFGLPRDHVSEFRAKLKWLPIRRRRDTMSCPSSNVSYLIRWLPPTSKNASSLAPLLLAVPYVPLRISPSISHPTHPTSTPIPLQSRLRDCGTRCQSRSDMLLPWMFLNRKSKYISWNSDLDFSFPPL